MNQSNQGAPCCDPIHTTVNAQVNTRLFATGATRDADQTKVDPEGFLSPRVLRRYSEYMNEMRLRNVPPGETVRSSDNWQFGIPLDAYMKSLLRHILEIWAAHREGQVDETALCAAFFNIQGYLFEVLHGVRPSAPKRADAGN